MNRLAHDHGFEDILGGYLLELTPGATGGVRVGAWVAAMVITGVADGMGDGT